MTTFLQTKPKPDTMGCDPIEGKTNTPEMVGKDTFASAVISWYRENGRQNMPWQNLDNPYQRWVSEIMLQQTQVATVIPYFLRFIKRFSDIRTLADSDTDEVLSYWTGLGYYARARNLHRTAQIIESEHGGVFPDTYEQLIALPGIGRSTAGAILAFSFGKSYPILDGNVRRVLARYHAIGGWPGQASVLRSLWEVAEIHTPCKDVGDYTQGMMDIGAEVCLRRQPRCSKCPLASNCKGFKEKNFAKFPEPRPRQTRSKRRIVMIMVQDGTGHVLLNRRPTNGIWGGLWSFPECPDEVAPEAWIEESFGLRVECAEPWDHIWHGLSHMELEIQPLPAKLIGTALIIASCVWYKSGMPIKRGLSAPVRHLLKQLKDCPI